MVFSTHIFLFYFLPLVLLYTYAVPYRFLSLGLTLFSYAFYGWANPAWVLLMLFSSYVDYFCGLALVKFSGIRQEGPGLPLLPRDTPRNRAQKTALGISIASNLAILGFFKYHDFLAGSINEVGRALGLGHGGLSLLHVALPVGISFYTFESMSYALDVYRGNARATRNPIDYQFFVADFPHLVAGPIIRYQTVAEQIRSRTFTYEKFARGVALFSLGMAKKVLLANPMGHVADLLFSAQGLSWHDAWYGITAFAFQVYFDFSGYSDMAVGLGLMIGLLFMKNFDDPFRAESITEFWQRWHVSLSTWLRDYLYLALGGNRRGAARTYANLMLVMLVGGLWHGASWNFVVWGGLHGGMLTAERLGGKLSPYRALPRALRIAVTFVVVCLSLVLFRTETLTQAWEYLRALFAAARPSSGADLLAASVQTPYDLAMYLLCAFFVWGPRQAWDFTQRLTPVRAGVSLALLLLSVLFMWTQTVSPFLYFQF